MPRRQGQPNTPKAPPPSKRDSDPNHGTKSTPQKRGGITVWPKDPKPPNQ